MKRTLIALLLILGTAGGLQALSLSYGSGPADLSFRNGGNNGGAEQLYPEGPLSFRVAAGSFWVADTLQGRVLQVAPDGKLQKTFTPPGVKDAYIVDFALESADPVTALYIIEGGSQRVLKLASDGQLLATLGSMGNSPGSFLQPERIEVSKDGHVAVADKMRRTLSLFDAKGTLVRELPWEWSGVCFDRAGNLCRLRWNDLLRRTQLIVETVDGKEISSSTLEIGEHINPKIWAVGESQTAIVTYVPGQMPTGKFAIAEFDASGKKVQGKEFTPPYVMNHFLDMAADGALYLGKANYDEAPKGAFEIQPFDWK